ncbi:hypothetical protein D1BOALGB6SA_10911 [Olavius sp. associated proteobacterium Delta 1]|nr:hypothetical protein D1BOALGB6SA_10911 [Olavius sp. associated proteobacterium Delta 1]
MDIQNQKIPILKHQITNKFQSTIFNDQNDANNCIASYRKAWYLGVDNRAKDS